MKLGSIRNMFKPLFGAHRGALTARLLHSIIWATIAIGTFMLLFDIAQRGWIPNLRNAVLLGLLIEHLVLLLLLRMGYVNTVAFVTLVSYWSVMTYGAWTAGGVHDLGVFVYMVIILIAALITNWQAPIALSVLSIVSVWMMAVAEERGDLIPQMDGALNLARDLTAIFAFLVVLIFLLVNVLRQALERIHDDFTEKLRVEQALRAGEERFRRIFQVSPIAICISNFNEGRLLDANQAYWALTGYSPMNALGRTTVELGIWEGEAERGKFLSKLLERRSLHDPEYEFVSQTNEKKYTAAYYELIDIGNQPAVLSLFHDITSQKQAQDALFRSEERMRAMLEATPDMMFELKQDGTILQFVPSAILDPLVAPEEFLGKKVGQVIPSIAEQTTFAIERALESRQVNAFEYQLSQNGEEKTFEARISAAGADTVLAIVRDVSLNRWAESERDKLIEELEAKNAELERFAYTVSHDLKSPLITIRGFLGFLREDTRSGNLTRLDEDIKRISDATEKMQTLLNDLLELSRIGRLINKPQPVPFEQIAAEAVELVQGRITQRNITVGIAPGLPIVLVDRPRLVEVMQNLIDNAAKFMGGQPSPHIEIGQKGSHGPMPILFVRDNGIGIAPEFMLNIFGLFNKLDALSEGTGVGLALVKRIIEFHQGIIWADSELGKGTTFYFTLPVPVSEES